MRFGLGLGLFEEGFSFNLLGKWVKLPILNRYAREPRDIMESWGFSYSDKALHLRWGTKTKTFWAPWDWGSNVRYVVLGKGGKWELPDSEREGIARKALIRAGVSRDQLWSIKIPDTREEHTAMYTYTTKHGEVQNTVATYHVEEREWRWLCFHWLYRLGIPFGPKKVSRGISIRFSEGIGESINSWKGGTTGCGYEMLPLESPHECLKRMERERKFR
jgi:hypothetical protein